MDSFPEISNPSKNSDSWYNEFAEKLLSEKFLLTALEFHAELTESGKEIAKLKDYFSNPGNFEQSSARTEVVQSINLPRSSSQATLDSLDLTRYSEDGERANDDKVAVLEFELRKARETINALRANLTEAAESETYKCRLEKENLKESLSNSKGPFSIKPHEQRALNFLINEYLLLNGYKLTSITFADENESQDFEDWDDVGLNCARPLELLYLYREGLKSTGFSQCAEQKPSVDFECQVTFCDETQQTLRINELESQIADLTEKINSMNVEFSEKLISLDNHDTTGEGSQKSFTTDQEYFEIIDTKKNIEDSSETKSDKSIGGWTNIVDKNIKDGLDLKSESQAYLESMCNDEKTDNNLENIINSEYILRDHKKTRESHEENKSESSLEVKIDSLNETEFDDFNEMFENNNKIDVLKIKKEENCKRILNSVHVSREVPEKFKNAILNHCDMIFPTFSSSRSSSSSSSSNSNNSVFTDCFQKTHLKNLTADHLINILSECLPKIIPNIILNKREEITPLLVLAVCFNKNPSVRDKLLNLLFNLKKKPDVEERRVILEALLVIAKLKGSSMVENEILPQCWEQITHKYVERRMLVAESCFLLAPYVSEAIRNSLILSITQQLLQDREEIVRRASVNILIILIVLMSDENKYSQVLEICLKLFNDESADVIKSVNELLLPTLAQWSFTLNKIQSSLFNKLLCKMKKEKNVHVFKALEILLPYLIMIIANSDFLLQLSSDSHPPPTKRLEFSCLCKGLCDPALFFRGSVSKVMGTFDFYTSQINFDEWPQLDWIMQVFVPDLLEAGDNCWEDSKVLKALVSVLRYLCLGLGKNITNYKVKPFLLEKLLACENAVVSGQDCKYSVIPLYLAGVLSAYPEELQEMSNTLRRFICALPLCGVSLIPLQVSVEILSQFQSWHILVLDAIWEGVVHQRPLVRGGSAILLNSVIPYIPDGLLSTKVMPALITLTSDSETSVRVNAIPALGMLMTAKEKIIRDKVCLTFQTLLQDSISLENHALIIQLVKTITRIYDQCELKFRNEVIPQLPAMTDLASKTKSKDLIEILIEAFSAITYSQTQISPEYIFSALLPGLRQLESTCSHLAFPHTEHVDSMIKEIERRSFGTKEGAAGKLSTTSPSSEAKRIANAVSSHTAVEDVRSRVTKIFNSRPNTLQNVSGIFKKKM